MTTRPRSTHRTAATTTLLAACGAGLLAAACADRATGPDEARRPLPIGAEERAALAAGLRYVTGHGLASDHPARAESVRSALDQLVACIDRNDADCALVAVAGARASLASRRETAGADANALLEAERMALAVEHAALRIAEVRR